MLQVRIDLYYFIFMPKKIVPFKSDITLVPFRVS